MAELSKEQFCMALKYVVLRELLRRDSGDPAVAALDAYLEAGGSYDGIPISMRMKANGLVDAATINPPPFWHNGTMDWGKWAAFSSWYVGLDEFTARKVRDHLISGMAIAHPSGQVSGDPFYRGIQTSDNTAIEWLLICAGSVTAISAAIWYGSARGWFGAHRSTING